MFMRIFDAFFGKIAFVEFFFGTLTIIFYALEEIIGNADISAFVKLSTKLSISVEYFLKLSAILENIGGDIDIENDRRIIENLSLSKKMTYRPPLYSAGDYSHT